MSQEIERKFLVTGEFKHLITRKKEITQAYLSSVPERTVRIRIEDHRGYITVKGSSSQDGTTRFEWEKEIPKSEAQDLLQLCEPGIISKTRYYIPEGKHIFEVDEFYGENAGLIIAEIELSSPSEIFEKPWWIGREVTGEARYYNATLSKHPLGRCAE